MNEYCDASTTGLNLVGASTTGDWRYYVLRRPGLTADEMPLGVYGPWVNFLPAFVHYLTIGFIEVLVRHTFRTPSPH